jgi:Rubrerythrin
MDFQDTQTYKNLQHAFEGELKASTKYRIYGDKAREDGFEQIGNIFDETSGNEQEHAEIWFKILHGGEMPSTLENLKDAYEGEQYEWTKMYRDFALTARQEGLNKIADLFEGVAGIERHHDGRYEQLASNIETGKVFCKSNETVWVCLNCGNLYWGKCAPKRCPVCDFPQGFYELNCDNF